jgi:hypothetical protein
MTGSFFSKLKSVFSSAERWYQDTPDRALEEAYQAAIAIKRIEDEHFNGAPVNLSPDSGGAVATYFQAEVKKHLRTIRSRLTTFKVSRVFVETTNPPVRSSARITRLQTNGPQPSGSEYRLSPEQYTSEVETTPDTATVLRKLQFIDAVIANYNFSLPISTSKLPTNPARNPPTKRPPNLSKNPEDNTMRSVQDSFYASSFTSDDLTNDPSKLDSSSFIPRSILRTANRFRKELNPDPDMEQSIIQDFRNSRARTRGAVRFLLLLMILPLLTQQITKHFLVGPVIDRLQAPEALEIKINPAIERRIYEELGRYKARLEFQNLISATPLTAPEIQEDLRQKAQSLSQQYQWRLREPIKNLFADFCSLMVFAILIVTGRREIEVLKSFLDEVLYGLSDSAKAFIIILFTDVFVGFHSPHGWEVIIERSLDHFGLPLNRDFINMFISTFPVMLDTVFKYWIFRYLNQISPSAVATYRNMNE